MLGIETVIGEKSVKSCSDRAVIRQSDGVVDHKLEAGTIQPHGDWGGIV